MLCAPSDLPPRVAELTLPSLESNFVLQSKHVNHSLALTIRFSRCQRQWLAGWLADSEGKRRSPKPLLPIICKCSYRKSKSQLQTNAAASFLGRLAGAAALGHSFTGTHATSTSIRENQEPSLAIVCKLSSSSGSINSTAVSPLFTQVNSGSGEAGSGAVGLSF